MATVNMSYSVVYIYIYIYMYVHTHTHTHTHTYIYIYDFGLAKNYRGITLTSIAAKIYNALLRNCIEPKIDNIQPKWLPKK